MIVAVTCKAEDPDAELDLRFGRARVFLLHDTSTGNWRAVANQHSEHDSHGSGSGAQAAKHLRAQNVDAVITGQLCETALSVLDKAGVRVYRASKLSAGQAVAALINGKLDRFAPTHEN
jgi:predicted Fe-Mo cluster-binding NifX family protein